MMIVWVEAYDSVGAGRQAKGDNQAEPFSLTDREKERIMPGKEESESPLVFSYLTLRKAIGLLGLALPFVLAFGGFLIFREEVQGSISHYYWTGMRDVFVGMLFAIGFFLLSYRGYERADRIAGILACAFAVGVALFPTVQDAAAVTGPSAGLPRIIGIVHFGLAALFFSTLIYFSLVLFTKTKARGRPTKQKLMRNRIYRGCGYLMAACILLTFVYFLLPLPQQIALAAYSPIYWLEAIAIIAFGVSWLVKGEAILKDE
jgi:heme A synthase